MAAVDLVLLSQVKAWLNINANDTASDALLSSWITAASRLVLNELQRGPDLGFRQVREVRDGTGTNNMMLRFWPVLDVTSLSINGTIYTPQTDKPFGSGYFWELWDGDDTQGHQQLWCFGANFPRLPQNVMITYNVGYQVQGEQVQVAGTSPVVYTTNRAFFSDQGVVYTSTGVALTKVTGTPAAGQYAINTENQYVFNGADTTLGVSITYSYTPEDLQRAVIDMVSWHFRNRDRIGMTSRSMGGQETTAFSPKAYSDMTALMIDNFKSMLPL